MADKSGGRKEIRDKENWPQRVTWHLMRDFASETRRIWSSPLIRLKKPDFPPTGDEITTSRSDAFDGYRRVLWQVLTMPRCLLRVSSVAKNTPVGWPCL